MIYTFKAAYTKLGVGAAPSSAPVCTVVDADDNVLANAQAATALTNLPGVYLYSYSGAAGLDLVALFHTADASMDQQDLYSYTPALITSNLDAAVSSRLAAADYIPPAGSGAIPWTYNLKDDSGNNIPDAEIWVTSDLAGLQVLASGVTDANGNVTFNLDAGTVYVWGQKTGYNFTNPDTEVVS